MARQIQKGGDSMKEFIKNIVQKIKNMETIEVKTDSAFLLYVDRSDVCDAILRIADAQIKKIVIDKKYCWQTCSATEHCKECNRLCNGSIDYYENYDFMAEEHNGGWIPVSERLPEDDGKQYMVQKTNGFIDILGFTKDAYKLDKYDFVEYKGKKKQLFFGYDSEYGYYECKCEAWQPLPQPYVPKGE